MNITSAAVLILETVPAEDAASVFTWSSEPRQGLALFRAKAGLFSQPFLDPEDWSSPRD